MDEQTVPWDPTPPPQAVEPAVFQTSATTSKLDDALAKAQGEVEGASKDKINPAFRSKYADLASVWDACREALAKHGIAVSQWPVHSEDGRVHLVTRLACSGEWICARCSIPASKQDAHGYGSAITYARRYALAAAVGVAPEDDDGNAAAGRGDDRKPPKSSKSESPKDALSPLRDGIRLKYQQLGGGKWRPWSEVCQAADAHGDSAEDLRKINDYLKAQLEAA